MSPFSASEVKKVKPGFTLAGRLACLRFGRSIAEPAGKVDMTRPELEKVSLSNNEPSCGQICAGDQVCGITKPITKPEPLCALRTTNRPVPIEVSFTLALVASAKLYSPLDRLRVRLSAPFVRATSGTPLGID